MSLWAAKGSGKQAWTSWLTCLCLIICYLMAMVTAEFEKVEQPKRGNALLSRYGRAVLSRYGKRSAPSFFESDVPFDGIAGELGLWKEKMKRIMDGLNLGLIKRAYHFVYNAEGTSRTNFRLGLGEWERL